MSAAHLLAFLGGEVGVGTFTRSRPRFGRWVPPSCQAGFNRSSQRTHKAPCAMEDWVRLGAAERKRVRKLRAKGLYDGPEIMADAVVVLPPDAEVSYLSPPEGA